MTSLTGRKRSKWKGIYTSVFPLKVKNSLSSHYRKSTIIFDRASTVLKSHIGQLFNIYKGKGFQKKRITKEMLGYKFGEFTGTSPMGQGIHKTLKNKNK